MPTITTYPEMNQKLVGILRVGKKQHCLYAAQRIEELEAEVKRLQDWKADVEDSTRMAMDEECILNERHCTCVPLLRDEVKRLRGEAAEASGGE